MADVSAAAAVAAGAAAALAAGCGARTQEARHDGGGHAAASAAATADQAPVRDAGAPATAAGGAAAATGGVGAVEVRVTWPDAPAAVRASAGSNPCGAARRPRATIDTLEGVAGVVVMAEDAAPAPPPPTAAAPRVELIVRACRIEPAVAVAARAGAELDLASADLRRHRVTLAAEAPAALLAAGEAAAKPAPRGAIDLPWAGAEAALVADAPVVYQLATEASPDELSWVVVGAPAAVTDEHGAATLKGVAAGHHRVRAWLPPRAPGTAPTTATGEVDVTAGGKAELTVRLGAP